MQSIGCKHSPLKPNSVMSVRDTLKSLIFRIPPEIQRNFREPDRDKSLALKAEIEQKYLINWRSRSQQGDIQYERDLNNHLSGRLRYDRTRIIPWLHAAMPLSGSHILEIGCGTGSSTVALAEQGAEVTGIDVDEPSLSVASARSKLFGVDAEFLFANAVEVTHILDIGKFEMIIFFACLEHMTLEERLDSLRAIWSEMATGSLLVIIETPNRLWFFDQHTSHLPFYHWLPDRLAFEYASRSPRQNFKDRYHKFTDENFVHFLRRGRGFSFHEQDVSIGDSRKLDIVSCLSTFDLLGKWKFSRRDRRYTSHLSSVYPDLHEGFFFPNLNLIIKKP